MQNERKKRLEEYLQSSTEILVKIVNKQQVMKCVIRENDKNEI